MFQKINKKREWSIDHSLFYAYLEEDSVVLLEESVAFSESLVLVSLVLESLHFDSFFSEEELEDSVCM